jgi:hypothetical protein
MIFLKKKKKNSECKNCVGLGIFLFVTASRTVLGPIQPPIEWVLGAFSLGVKRPGREAAHSPPSSAEVKNAWSYISTPPIRLHGVVLSYAQGQLYLYLYDTHIHTHVICYFLLKYFSDMMNI